MGELLQDAIGQAAWRSPAALALRDGATDYHYAALARAVDAAAAALLGLGLARGERVAVYLDKRAENVLALYGAAAAGLCMVPINPLLKPAQVAHILRDSGARVLVTSPARLSTLDLVLARCPDLRCVLQCGDDDGALPGLPVFSWNSWLEGGGARPRRHTDNDLAALVYGAAAPAGPRGVAFSHRNLVAAARSLAHSVDNNAQDRILMLQPLSQSDGLNQLGAAFASGAAAILMNHLLTRDIPAMVARERITGLCASATLWIQLAELAWDERAPLRYLVCSGAPGPDGLAALERCLPAARIHLAHGQAEAQLSCLLAPQQLARRPGSIGTAVPNTELLVLDPQGRPCAAGQPGELVQRGPLVALGYWNDPGATARRFRPLHTPGLPLPETVLWTGDMVRADEDGYLYPLGRRDDVISSAGYRFSPGEIEDVVQATGLVRDVVAYGVAHPVLGQSVALAAVPMDGCVLAGSVLLAACRARLPGYMLPASVDVRSEPLPRLACGKIDRQRLARAEALA